MKAKRETFVLRTLFEAYVEYKVVDFDLGMQFTPEHSEKPHMERNLCLWDNIVSGSYLYCCSEREIRNCDCYKARVEDL